MNKIGFIGEGWGAVVAVKSLQKYFELQCMSSDETVVNELIEGSKSVSSFDEFNCELIVSASYKPIISEVLITKYKIINIHYSLLPAYRGLHSTAWAIMNGEEKLGLTIHLMNKYIDDGPILDQKEFINDQISSATYYLKKMNSYIKENLGDIIDKYDKGLLLPKEQDRKQASWVGKRVATHNLIDFHKGYEYCKRLFRVLQGHYPKPQIEYKKERYAVGDFSFHPSRVDTDIARILNVDDDGVWVKSIDGYIIIYDIKDLAGNLVDKNIFKIGTYINA